MHCHITQVSQGLEVYMKFGTVANGYSSRQYNPLDS